VPFSSMESISSIIAFLQLGMCSVLAKEVGSSELTTCSSLATSARGANPGVAHAAEAKRCVVVVVGIQVLVIDVVVHLRVTSSSKEQ
jgi:hypothetical protein